MVEESRQVRRARERLEKKMSRTKINKRGQEVKTYPLSAQKRVEAKAPKSKYMPHQGKKQTEKYRNQTDAA